MRRFRCRCGQPVFFDNTSCLTCGRPLAFDPDRLEVRSFDVDAAGGTGPVRRCRNHHDHGNCNWLPETDGSFCLACGLNEVIPNLDAPGNLELWTKIERAKRRLLYTLLELGLPVSGGSDGLAFRILEDRRRNPDVLEDFVATGHDRGTITLNLAEAHDATRHAERELMQERYRTVLGHLRHEAGHHYFGLLVSGPELLDEARRLFGDERAEYAAALDAHYERGPREGWERTHVSAYASAHPVEDFAETFAHYLHIVDALETAESAGLEADDDRGWIDRWRYLSVTLNELNRSLGLDDPYPFVLSSAVSEKLLFMDRLVRRAT